MARLTALKHRTLPAADEMAFGIVVSEGNVEIAAPILEEAVRTLREAGCPEHLIQIKYVPSFFDLAMGAQFFAEYTDVDAVLVLGCHLRSDSHPALVEGVMQGVMQVQQQWNMPCAWGVADAETAEAAYARYAEGDRTGARAAASAIRMVRLQIDMEAASPNALPDQRNLN